MRALGGVGRGCGGGRQGEEKRKTEEERTRGIKRILEEKEPRCGATVDFRAFSG